MSQDPYKRKIYFINKEFQGKFIFQYFMLLTLGSLMFIGIFSFFSSNTVSIVYENYHLQLGTTPGLLFKKILSTQWLFIVLGGIFISVITLRLTHRIAGPFYRFEKKLDEMIVGNISGKVFLREKDEGKALAEKINRFNSNLAENLAKIQTANSRINLSVTDIEIGWENMKEQEILQMIETIKKNRENIETTINAYTLTRK